MRRAAILLMAALLPLSLVTVGADARTASQRRSLPSFTPVEADALTEALDEGELSAAEYALQRARTLSHLKEVRDEFGDVLRPDPHAATYILRDLALRAGRLSGPEAAEAEQILARPDTSGDPDDGWSSSATQAAPVCGTNICVHYVTDTPDRATASWAASTLATFEEVWTKEVDVMGFNAPKSDGTKGGNSKLDVYIDNIDVDGLYGYCATGSFSPPPWDQPVYCSVDNDYTTFVNLGLGTDINLLKATSAHEFFHAVQYSYDAGDDAALGEMTATWMEDEVYDAINDNRNYVNNSMADPHVPADSFDSSSSVPSGFQYGNWVWMRYLSQRFGADFFNALYDRLDARTGAPDDYSIEGITNVLAAESTPTTFGAAFADFAAKNAKPSAFYDEAAEAPAYYAASPRDATHTLTSTAATGTLTDVDHLSSRYISLKPGAGATQLTVAVNMTDPVTGSQAILVSIPSNGGAPTYSPVALDGNGDGTITINSFDTMTEVVLVMVNASNRYSGCTKFAQTTRTCNGNPVDDNKAYSYSASAGPTTTTPPDPGGGGGGGGTGTGPGITGVSDGPDPFSPNGDGRKDKVKINFTLVDQASVVINIYKNDGVTLVKSLFTSGANQVPPSNYFIKWNGKSNSGRVVKNGTYVYAISATDALGTTVKTGKTTVRR